MSLGYAERLSYREDLGGRLGDPEILENAQEVLQKIEELTSLVRAAKSVVAFTGAGISTACGIPDFRGPNGVWTAQRAGKPLPKAKTSFLYAQPSLTHMTLLGLMQAGKLKYICSQNVDSLHLRSGVPRSGIAELHGNCFAERCKKCKTEYVRDFEMDSVGFKPTGRMCTKGKCQGYLVDHILDWEDALPPAELKATEQHASAADVSICLGTSLQIIPAANLPLRTVKAGGSLAIINLQATPKDKKAAVVIHAKVDQVMAMLMQQLEVPIPAYVRTDKLLLSHKVTSGPQPTNNTSSSPGTQPQQQEGSSWSFSFSIASVHGEDCPLPMVASARVSFYDQAVFAAHAAQLRANSGGPSKRPAAAGVMDPAAAAAAPEQAPRVDVQGLKEVLPAQEVSGQVPWRLDGSCPAGLQAVAVVVDLQLVAAADEDKRKQQVHYTISRPQAPQATNATKSRGTRAVAAKQRQQAQQPDGSTVVGFVTQLRDYSREQQELVRGLLRDAGREVPLQSQHTAGDAEPGQQLGFAAAAGAAADAEADAGPDKHVCHNGAVEVAGGAAGAAAGAVQHGSGGSSPAGSPRGGSEGGPGLDVGDIDRPPKRLKQEPEAA